MNKGVITIDKWVRVILAYRYSLSRPAQVEQSTIGDEAKIVLTKLAKVVAAMDGPAAERPRTALTKAEDSRLAATLVSATGDLKSANLLSAAGNEKRARDVFQDLAKLLQPARDNLEVMKQAVRDLEKAIAQQKEVKEETKQATQPKAEKTEVAEAEKKQAEVVDKTDSIREDVEKAAPKAAEELKAAVEKQQEARAQLQDPAPKRTPQNEPVATEKQEQALAKMAEAKQTLEKQIAIAEAQQQKPKDKLADLKELKKKVEPVAVVLLLPMFFTYSGLNTRLDMVNNLEMLGIALVVLAASCLGKFGACWAAARATGEDNRTALAVGALMNSRGLMELIIINIGLQKGIIQPALFSVLVLMAIVTTLMASPIFELVYGRHARAKGELGGIAKGE